MLRKKKKKEKKPKKKLNQVLKDKFSLKNIKEFFVNIVKTTKYIVLDNKLVFIYIMGAVINP